MSEDTQKPKRKVSPLKQPASQRGQATIRIFFDQPYQELVKDVEAYRAYLKDYHKQHPTVFPADFDQGFQWHDSRTSNSHYGKLGPSDIVYIP